MHKYHEFGFNIASFREMMNVPVASFDGEADITIYEEKFDDKYMKLFDSMTGTINQMSSINKDEMIIAHKNYGIFAFRDGNKIGCKLLDSCNTERFTIFLNCFGMAHVMIQRREVAVHGSGIEYNGKGIIISGVSGAGKSSITEELLKRGCGFLTDDLIRVGQKDGINYICPANPERKLCLDAAERFNYDPSLLRKVIDEDREKFYLLETDKYVNELIKAELFIILDVADIPDVKVIEITGGDKIKQVMECLFRLSTYIQTGQDPALFMKMMSLAIQVRMYRIIRPKDGDTIADRADIIIDTIENM